MRQKRILHFSVNVLFWFFPSKTLCKNASFRLKTQMIIRFCSNLNRISLFLKSRFCSVCTASYKVGKIVRPIRDISEKKPMHIAFLSKSILILKEWGKIVLCKLVLDMHAYLLKIIKPTWFFFLKIEN